MQREATIFKVINLFDSLFITSHGEADTELSGTLAVQMPGLVDVVSEEYVLLGCHRHGIVVGEPLLHLDPHVFVRVHVHGNETSLAGLFACKSLSKQILRQEAHSLRIEQDIRLDDHIFAEFVHFLASHQLEELLIIDVARLIFVNEAKDVIELIGRQVSDAV